MPGPILWGPNNTATNLEGNLSQAGRYIGAGIAMPWVSGTSYVAGDSVSYDKNLYICVTSNTAGTTFEADVASGFWYIQNLPMVGPNRMTIGHNYECGDVSGWQVFTISGYTAGTFPTTAPTIGSATSMAIAATSTSPLDGQYSLSVTNTASTNLTAGQGVISQAYAFSTIDQAKVMAIQFAYQAFANTTNGMSFTGTSAGTWALYIYDVTNSVWIQPAGVYNLVQGTGPATSKTNTFQTASNAGQFRVALLCINSTTATTPAAGAMNLYLDDWYVGPQPFSAGPNMSDWTAFTPSGTWTTNTTYSGFYKVVGDSVRFRIQISLSGAPTATGLYFNIPFGWSIDSTKMTSTIAYNQALGTGAGVHSGSGYNYQVLFYSSTAVSLVYQSSLTATQTIVNATAPVTYASGDIITTDFMVPIAGKSANTVNSADTDTRLVAMNVNQSNPTATITSTLSLLKFTSTPSYDTHAQFNTSTGLYTVPVSGFYKVSAGVGISATYANTQTATISIAQTGTTGLVGIAVAGAAEGTMYPTWTGTIKCNAGDTLAPYIASNGTTPTVVANAAANYFIVERLSGPAVVQANETVAMKYQNGTNQAVTANTTNFSYDTKIYDTHNAFNGSIYTVPVSGKYTIKGCDYLTTGGWSSYVATAAGTKLQSITTNANANKVGNGSVDLQCNAGDQLVIRSDLSATRGGSLPDVFISILRIGN